jgi:transcriptional regulator with XRE-family HTH domain
MIIGERLREMREQKKLSQGEIEKRTGLLRCYISRVENGHTSPAIQTIEKMARALDVPMHQLFYDGEQPPELQPFGNASDRVSWGNARKEILLLRKLQSCLGRMKDGDRKILLSFAHKLARRNRKREPHANSTFPPQA